MYLTIIIIGILIGILAGFISGLLGIGSGMILVPTVAYIFDENFKIAIACSLLTIAILAPVGAYRHYRSGNVKIKPVDAWVAPVVAEVAILTSEGDHFKAIPKT